MDSLLEALSTGQAFKKEGRRRTPREKGKLWFALLICKLLEFI